MQNNEYDSKIVQVRATSRWHKKREVTFTCERCKREVMEWRYPGPLPQYCSECGPGVQKEKNTARVRRVRDRKRRGVSSALPNMRFMV